jgi:phosphate/sulfate permease
VNNTDNSVKLLLSILIIVSLAGKSNANTLGDVTNALGPNVLVQRGVNTNIATATTNITSHEERQGYETYEVFIACWAKALISLIALGALFLKVTPNMYNNQSMTRNP